MPQIIAWKCSHTNKVFAVKSEYLTHLKKLSAKRIAARKKTAFEKTRVDFFANMRATVCTFDELQDFIVNNWDKFCENAKYNDHFSFRKKKKHDSLQYIQITNVRWSDNVSCSHSAPIGKSINWDRKSSDPTSYPGWIFRMEYNTVDHNSSTYEYSSNTWQGTGLHTGSGGYATNYYFYGVLFANDWPALSEPYEKAEIWKKLNSDIRTIDEIVEIEF